VETPISNAGVGSLPKMMITSPFCAWAQVVVERQRVHHGQEGCPQRLSRPTLLS
jgi:hypothetical protein